MAEESMNINISGENSRVHTSRPKSQLRRTILSPLFCSIAASFGIFGGISALIIGLLCVVIHSLLKFDRAFDTVGTVLLVAAIPMILIGSIFLDEINANR